MTVETKKVEVKRLERLATTARKPCPSGDC
jgi:hypothetical protein